MRRPKVVYEELKEGKFEFVLSSRYVPEEVISLALPEVGETLYVYLNAEGTVDEIRFRNGNTCHTIWKEGKK